MNSLDDPIIKVSYLLQHTANTLQRQSDQVLQERLGIGVSQFRILMILYKKPDVQQRTLAEGLGQTEASISRQIKLLQEKGMLVTVVNRQNLRQHLTTITPKGVKVVEAAREILTQGMRVLLADYSDKQVQQFVSLLSALHLKICADGRPFACDKPFGI